MGIRPIDMQILVPKTAEYSKQFQGEVDKKDLDQQTFAQVAAKHAELKQSIVIETNETEQSVNKDGGNKQEHKGNKRKKNEEKEDKEKDKNTKGVGLFDMRI